MTSADAEFRDNVFRIALNNMVREEMEKGVKEETVLETIKRARVRALSLNMPPEYISALSDLFANSIRPNIIVDWKSHNQRAAEENCRGKTYHHRDPQGADHHTQRGNRDAQTYRDPGRPGEFTGLR